MSAWKISSALSMALLLVGCGQGGSSGTAEDGSLSAIPASLQLVVEDESRFTPAVAPYNQIDHFVITVSGAGLIAPIVETFPVGTAQAEIAGLSTGAVVDVKVEAVNLKGVVFKRGYAENVPIDTSVAEAVLNIKQVPIFTDLTDVAQLDDKRLHLKTFSEPGHRISLTARDAAGIEYRVTTSEGDTEFSGEENTGLAHLYPKNLTPAAYTLILRDLDNRESTTLSITIREGRESVPLQLTSGGTLGSQRYLDDTDGSHLLEVLYGY